MAQIILHAALYQQIHTYVYNGQGERDGYCKTTREGPIVRELSIKTCLPAAQVANDNMQRYLNFTYVCMYLNTYVYLYCDKQHQQQ